MLDLDKVLQQIRLKYNIEELLCDGMSKDFVTSVCSYFVKNGQISARQLNALLKITDRINEHGAEDKPVAKIEPEKPGFLGLNCRTGEAVWNTWQIFEQN